MCQELAREYVVDILRKKKSFFDEIWYLSGASTPPPPDALLSMDWK